MMSLESLKDYIQSLNQKEIIRVISAYSILYMILIGILLYRHHSMITDMHNKIHLLNKARKDIQSIVTEYEHIKSKQNDVDQLLAKDKNFYLQKYYQETIASVNITNQTVSNLISQTWPNGYTEESLQINVLQITMQKLCEFLQALQGNSRVFVKNLDITKANVPKKINVTLSIATLKPVAEKHQ